MKTILLTGCTSALGDAVSRKLLEEGHALIGTYHDHFPSELSLFKNFMALRISFKDVRTLHSIPEKVDALITNASLNPPTTLPDEKFCEYNVEFSRSLIEQCGRRGCSQFAFMSSMSAYGDIQTDLVSEDTVPNKPDAYGDSKLKAEQLHLSLSSKYPVLVLRLPGIVGRRTNRNFLSMTLSKILRDEPISIANPDSKFNNLAHVQDLADLVSSFLSAKVRFRHSVYNCGASTTMRFEDLILKIYELLNKKPSYRVVPSSKKSFLINVDRLISDGFRPYAAEFALSRFVMDWCR